MPHPEEMHTLHVIADASPDHRRVLVSRAEADGAEAACLRNLQLEGLIVVMDHEGHPTIFLTNAGQHALTQQPRLFDAY